MINGNKEVGSGLRPKHAAQEVMKFAVRALGIVVFLIILGFSLKTPGAASAIPRAQEDPILTEEFIISPPAGEGQGGDPEASAAALDEELPDGWQLPINLSLSGATSDPQMVRDGKGNLHVLWRDAIDGYVYSVSENGQWSVPTALELPFATRRFFPDLGAEDETPLFRPQLVADGRGDIHAFWIDDSENTETLYHSRVPSVSFANYESWTARESLENDARKVAVTAVSDGFLHLIYILAAESAQRPSGIYYRRLSLDGGWTTPVLLYGSRYLRDVEQEEANLQILAADNGNVYVVWDDTRREQLFFTSSANEGTTWRSVQEIDRRSTEDDEEAQGPGQIRVGGDGDNVLLTWQGGHEPGGKCAQYTMMSEDSGENWFPRQLVENLPDCLYSAQFVPTGRGLFLIGTMEPEGLQSSNLPLTTYLMAWDGSRWSDPQVQKPLTSFTNPDTFQSVRLGCHYALGGDDQMQILGCDNGNGRDIWLITREIGAIDDWFPPPPIWQGPDSLGSSNEQILELQLIADDEGGAHAFWCEGECLEIYHAAWDGQSWSAGRPIINAPKGHIEQIAATSAGDRLYLVFRDSTTGLHFSQAAVSRPTEWSDPLHLAENHLTAASPSIIASRDGKIHVAYTVPLNERRGIYLIQSDNNGETWTLPLQVFDGAAWDMVEMPYLAATGENQLHLLWTRRSLPPDAKSLALAYSRSEDLGRTWSEAEEVVETEAMWSRLVGLNERLVHRLWAEESNGRLVVWHSFSQDSGLSWSRAAQVISSSTETAPALAIDSGARPHILALDNGRLLDLLWHGESWAPGDDLVVPFAPGGLLAAAGDSNELLLALYAGQILAANAEEEAVNELYAMSRSLEISPELLVPLPTLTPTPAPTATPGPTATPEPQPTLVFSAEQEKGLVQPLPGLPANVSLTLLTIIPAALIVLASIIVVVRIARKR